MAKLFKSLMGRPMLYELQYYIRGVRPGYLYEHADMFNCARHSVPVVCRQRFYSTSSDKEQSKSLQQQTQSQLSEDVQPITFKTVKETTKTASYLSVILIGVGVTGVIFYAVFRELFSGKSPNNVYSKALNRVISDVRVQDALGEPISGYGEENRRGRRQHVSHLLYQKGGENRLRMKFYISGSRNRATVHLEMKEDESGNYVYRYLFVELDDFGRHPIVFEDNRHAQPARSTPAADVKSLDELDLSTPLNMNLNFPDAGLK